MNLRTVTIWTTGVVLIFTVFLWIYAFGLWMPPLNLLLAYLFLHPSILLINLFFALKLERNVPQICLLVATGIYGIWTTWLVILLVSIPDPFVAMIGAIYFGGIMTLPVIFPLWFIATYSDRVTSPEDAAYWERRFNESDDNS